MLVANAGAAGPLRHHIDLESEAVREEPIRITDLEDRLGGIARGMKLLEDERVDDAYAPQAPLICNLGALSGSPLMTGLRTFFHGYSPLKSSLTGRPGAIWSAGSGKFATKLRHTGVEELVFRGRATRPVFLYISAGPEFEFRDAADLKGLDVHEKIQALFARYPEAHFAVIGPAGEHFEQVRFAAIGLSTVNQLKSGDPKARYCGRGGLGGVMGSKNLLAIVADAPDPRGRPAPSQTLKELNLEIARGKGSRRFRDAKNHGGGGGTWANYEALDPVHALPERNFVPTGTDVSVQLERPEFEKGPYVVKDEACYRCGIKCHKNVYEPGPDQKPGRFRAKLDYEPLNLLSSNLGIFDVDAICDLIERTDRLGMDAISMGVTLSYAMEYNRRHPDAPIAGGLGYGDAAAARAIIDAIGTGALPELGQGSKRLSEALGETGYAMQCKGIEFPAYLPQTNPGYPFALAGGHMSMSTYLLLLFERETSLDYWVEAITSRGPMIMRDDLLGACKFAGISNSNAAKALRDLAGIETTPEELREVVLRTYLRGYRIEKLQGFGEADYDMPAEVHDPCPSIDLPHFNTREFFAELKRKVLARFDALLEQELPDT